MTTGARTVSIVLFEGFELLDVFGPAELFSPGHGLFVTHYIGPTREPVASIQGVAVVPDFSYADAPAPDIVLVPGGFGTRGFVADPEALSWLRDWAGQARIVTSV